MHFVDRVHVEKIAEALWNPLRGGRPGAALMVGAGMSRNAARPSLAREILPDWNELTARLIAELHPDTVGEEKQRTEALRRAGAVSGFLRLAEEYEATHGRGALHNFLLRNVPDQSVSPGELHKALLNLPWQDVFTTNWDTLLERTAADEPFRGYTAVTRAEQIPRSSPPRIVKLHGSFPNIEPFIFTEEDFRTYPKKFAPFVNIMRQGLMENILVLIGFSGDDPNFLQWAGWVRDELGGAGPQVYLCGWLELREGQRRLLEKLGVVPVDYSRHDQARNGCWDGAKHAQALRRFIADLDGLRTDKMIGAITPGEPNNRLSINVTRLCEGLKADMTEDEFSSFMKALESFNSNKAFLSSRISRYSIPRNVDHREGFYYAENTFLRSENIRFISSSISVLLKILKKYGGVHSYSQKSLIIISDYMNIIFNDATSSYLDVDIRFFISLERIFGSPFTPGNGPPADGSLVCGEAQAPPWYRPRRPDGTSAIRDLPFHEAKPRLQELWLGSLRRHRIDSYDSIKREKKFFAWADALARFEDHDPKIREGVWYQRCLHGLRCFELGTVDAVMREWRDADNVLIRDPYWAVREAGILVEMGRTDAAVKLATKAFAAMQRQMQPATREALTSREVWTIIFLLIITQCPTERMQLNRRLIQIATPGIDPVSLLEKWRMEFRPDIRLGTDVYGAADDDILRRDALITAQRFVCFVEKIGFPAFAALDDPSTGTPVIRDVLAQELMAAGNRLAKKAPGRSLAVCLRACADGAAVGRIAVFRHDILGSKATLAGQWAGRLVGAVPALLDRIGRTSGAEHSLALGRGEVALTALGFLVRHVEATIADEVFRLALTCHLHAVVAAQQNLYLPLEGLWQSLVKAASPTARQRWLGEMLTLPPPGPGGVVPFNATLWPDPLAAFAALTDWPTSEADPRRGERSARRLLEQLAEIDDLPQTRRPERMRKSAFRRATLARLRVLQQAGWIAGDLAVAVALAIDQDDPGSG